MAGRLTTTHGPSRGDPLRSAGSRGDRSADVSPHGPPPGNQALQQLLRERAIQARLTVQPAGDEYEREADRIADRLLAAPEPALAGPITTAPTSISRLQRQEAAELAVDRPPPEEEERKRRVEEMRAVEEAEEAAARQAREEPAAPGTVAEAEEEAAAPEEKKDEQEIVQTSRSAAAVAHVTPELERSLASPGSGRPLPADLRRFFEPRFGRDLSGIRIHADAAAARAARQLDAEAFTRGRHVYFAEGAWRPESESGRRLLAHELVHTQQQDPSPVRKAAASAGDRTAASGPGPTRAEGGTGSSAAPARGTAASGPPTVSPTSVTTGPGPAVTPLQRQALQRQTDGSDDASDRTEQEPVDPTTLPLETGRLDPTSETITFSEIEVPGFKLADHRGSLYGSRRSRQKKGYVRGNTNQRSHWQSQLGQNTESTVETLREKYRTAHGGEEDVVENGYVFKGVTKHGADRYFLGELPRIASELTLPSWDAEGRARSYDVDHIVELQLANWDVEGWANSLPNMELLDSSTNRSSGSFIRAAIDARVRSFIQATHEEYGASVETVKSRYHLEFEQAKAGGEGAVEEKVDYWTAQHIRDGDHLGPVQVASMGELGGDGKVVVFPDAAGGQTKQFQWPGDGVPNAERDWLKPYNITEKSFDTEEGSESRDTLGSLTFVMPEDHPKYKPSGEGPTTVTVGRVHGARYAGFIDKSAVRRQLLKLRTKLSPITVHTLDIGPAGIHATGQILPSVPLLQGTGIDYELQGDDLTFSKSFAGPELQMPRPFEVRESTLTVSAGTRGLAVDGRVDFAIEQVGAGHLGARAGTTEAFALEGAFAFDSALFDPAEIEATYTEGRLAATGRIGVPSGKVPGVTSATVEATYSEEEGRLTATGEAELDLPGVEKGLLHVDYSEAEGLTIGGAFDLGSDVPGVRSGRVEAALERGGEGKWSLTASGTAEPDVPGVDAQLSISYEDGLFDMSALTSYERGMASGTVEVGVTNRAVDEEGEPVGDPGDTLTLYGGGEVSLALAPWLQATAGLRLLPDGSMEVAGRVGLPSSLELFPEKSYDRNIFRIGLDIPIVGVAVAGQRIGIFATVSGGLDLSAGVGPGELTRLELGVTYNPEHEEDTRVTGGAELQVPAHAGLRLSIRGGLGAGIPIVSATAALEIGGALGLEGMARAAVQVDWTPGAGLVLDAEGEIFVEPKLVFDVAGIVLVEADLLFTSIELYSRRWNLAGFELGSGLRFGIRFPVHYEEGQPFDVDWNQVEFEAPDIDPDQVLAGLMDQIV